MRFYEGQPDPLQFAEPLTGSQSYRFRIGDYRVIFKVLHNTVWVQAIRWRDKGINKESNAAPQRKRAR
jgi:mRNA-degrading endonuclease RelE of RelBE toxin-antitoxin system